MNAAISELTPEQKAWFGALLARVLTIDGVGSDFEDEFIRLTEDFFESELDQVGIIAQTFGQNLPEPMRCEGLDKPQLKEIVEVLTIEAAIANGLNAAKKVFLRRLAKKLELTEPEFEVIYKSVQKTHGNAGPGQGTRLKSVFVQPFTCKVCHSPVSYFRVKNRTQTTLMSPFGVPLYRGAREGFESADFNHIRVLVCPTCLFSSMSPQLFDHEKKDAQPNIQFGKKFMELWEKEKPHCAELVQSVRNDLFHEKRGPQTAMITYQLGIRTHETLMGIYPKFYLFHRYLVAHRIHLAELLFVADQKEAGLEQISKASEALDSFVFRLSTKESILPTKLAFLLAIYFGKSSAASGYLNMLESLERKEMHKLDQEARKNLNRAIVEVNKVWDDRETFPEIVDSFYASLSRGK